MSSDFSDKEIDPRTVLTRTFRAFKSGSSMVMVIGKDLAAMMGDKIYKAAAIHHEDGEITLRMFPLEPSAVITETEEPDREPVPSES